jgi:alanine-glyoxylate transaminase/serine-glyoxylate transaminase/serine-pyruvate transaminase
MDDCKAGIQYIFQTNNKMTLSLSSTGHSAMECVMTNMLEKDDVVLIATNGIWGQRAQDMAGRQGMSAELSENLTGKLTQPFILFF